MDQPTPLPVRFAWVRKPDGQLMPFEADKISRDLFAASETLGKPDAFLARELTDSILHFLSAEVPDAVPTTTQIADLVVKVTRELGQPALARTFADAQALKNGAVPSTPAFPESEQAVKTGPLRREVADWIGEALAPTDLAWKTAQHCLRDYSAHEVFARDLVAAQHDGLLSLCGLDAPLELAGWVVATLPALDAMVEAIEAARGIAGSYLAFDGPEHILATRGATPAEATAYARTVKLALRHMHLHAVINLHCAEPPPHLGELAMGPLFEIFHSAADPFLVQELSAALLDEFLRTSPRQACVRVDWHLGKADFTAEASVGLLRLAKRALEGSPLAFVFDRPRRVVGLAEGLDRHHPASLLTVLLHLPRLIEQSGPEMDEAIFLRKLGSLARLALSAAKQKRDFLRRHAQSRPLLTDGFLLDRARLHVVPVGLEAAAQMLLGRGLCSGGSAPEFARQIAQRMNSVLRDDGRLCLLDTCVDSALECQMESAPADIRTATGLTSWDATATAKSQLRAGSVLHAVTEAGTALVLLPEDALPAPEEIAEWLAYAWKQTEVVRVRLVRTLRPQNQLAVTWER